MWDNQRHSTLPLHYPQEFRLNEHAYEHVCFCTLSKWPSWFSSFLPILRTKKCTQVSDQQSKRFFCACHDPTFKLTTGPEVPEKLPSSRLILFCLFVCFSFFIQTAGRPRRSRSIHFFHSFLNSCNYCHGPANLNTVLCDFAAIAIHYLAWGQWGRGGWGCCLTALCTTLGQNSQNTDR